MNEKLLQYLWNYKIFSNLDFTDTEGRAVEVEHFGAWNHNSGPDFLFAKVRIGGLLLAGNIELHVRSSDWIFHGHSTDAAYDNIILHVVYSDDTEIEDLAKRNIPVLELKNHIEPAVIQKYAALLNEVKFIPCEEIFHPGDIPVAFTEESLLKRLDEKAAEIDAALAKYGNDYEAVLFHLLAYAFGLKVNALIFRQIAENIDYSTFRKCSSKKLQAEALLFGKAGWLQSAPDEETRHLQKEYEFLKTKYSISDLTFAPKFLRLRPPNFPTIRLSQLANLYHREQSLFAKLMETPDLAALYRIFEGVSASEYWDSRFNFGKISAQQYPKELSKDFISLVVLNAVLPLKYAFHRNQKEDALSAVIDLYAELPAEKNTIIDGWKALGAEMKSSLDTQAYLFHYNNYCLAKKCLNCSIGYQMLKHS